MILTERKFREVLDEVMYGKEKAKEKFNALIKEIEELKIEIKDLQIEKAKEKASLNDELNSLKSRRKIEEEEIKHLIKMKEEKLLLDTSKHEVELQKLFTQREMDLQTTYHDKVLKTIDDSRKESKELYNKIMERLPNVNMEIKRRG